MEFVRSLPYDHPFRWDATPVGGSKLWRPDELGSSLALWLDAEDADSITLNGTDVAQWADKSGNGRNAEQSSASAQPALVPNVINGLPVVRGDGTDDILDIPNGKDLFQNIDGATIILVGQYSQIDANDLFMFGFSGASNLRFGIGSFAVGNVYRATSRRLDSDPAPITASGGTVVANTPVIQRGDYDYSDGLIAVSVDGVQLDSQSRTVGTTSNTPGDSTSMFGTGVGTFYPLDLGEIIVANAPLSSNDRQKLEGYLAWHWELEANLPVGHPYASTPPVISAGTGFNFTAWNFPFLRG